MLIAERKLGVDNTTMLVITQLTSYENSANVIRSINKKSFLWSKAFSLKRQQLQVRYGNRTCDWFLNLQYRLWGYLKIKTTICWFCAYKSSSKLSKSWLLLLLLLWNMQLSWIHIDFYQNNCLQPLTYFTSFLCSSCASHVTSHSHVICFSTLGKFLLIMHTRPFIKRAFCWLHCWVLFVLIFFSAHAMRKRLQRVNIVNMCGSWKKTHEIVSG